MSNLTFEALAQTSAGNEALANAIAFETSATGLVNVMRNLAITFPPDHVNKVIAAINAGAANTRAGSDGVSFALQSSTFNDQQKSGIKGILKTREWACFAAFWDILETVPKIPLSGLIKVCTWLRSKTGEVVNVPKNGACPSRDTIIAAINAAKPVKGGKGEKSAAVVEAEAKIAVLKDGATAANAALMVAALRDRVKGLQSLMSTASVAAPAAPFLLAMLQALDSVEPFAKTVSDGATKEQAAADAAAAEKAAADAAAAVEKARAKLAAIAAPVAVVPVVPVVPVAPAQPVAAEPDYKALYEAGLAALAAAKPSKKK